MAKKTYVETSVFFDTNGNMLPIAFWKDGFEYEVDKIFQVKNAVSMKTGGVGIRYLVSISNDDKEVYDKKCHLWFERGEKPELWFIVEE